MVFTTISQAIKETGLAYLGSINSSAKIVKNLKVMQMTYVLYLAPATTSGYNVCPNATDECKLGCLNTSGRARMEYITGATKIQDSRNKKTKLFFEHNDFFMAWLKAEIIAAKLKAEKMGYGFSVRLNGTSDIDWQHTGIFNEFPEISFYDYTKNFVKFNGIAKNYDLTYSYTGYNWKIAESLLKQGFNVAVIFNVTDVNQFPKTFKGYNVIDGDETDYRINDAKGVIVALKWKNIANKVNNELIKTSKFVVQLTDIDTKTEVKIASNNVQNIETKVMVAL